MKSSPKLCEHGTENINGININFFCNLLNDYCTSYRWCTNDQCIKMLNSYQNCKVRSNEMAKNKLEKSDLEQKTQDIQIENISEDFKTGEINIISEEQLKKEILVEKPQEKLKKQTLSCPVLSINKNTLSVDFKGYGIVTPKPNKENISLFIDVVYESDIGKPDFKIIEVK